MKKGVRDKKSGAFCGVGGRKGASRMGQLGADTADVALG